MSYTIILVTIFIVIIIAFVGFYYYYSSSSNNSESFDTQNNNINNELAHTADLMYFFTDWCPYCKKAKPEWTKIMEYLDSNKINNYNVHCIEYDCTTQTPEIESMMDKYKIDGFPTLKLRINGNIKTFESTLTKDNVIVFLKENIN